MQAETFFDVKSFWTFLFGCKYRKHTMHTRSMHIFGERWLLFSRKHVLLFVYLSCACDTMRCEACISFSSCLCHGRRRVHSLIQNYLLFVIHFGLVGRGERCVYVWVRHVCLFAESTRWRCIYEPSENANLYIIENFKVCISENLRGKTRAHNTLIL